MFLCSTGWRHNGFVHGWRSVLGPHPRLKGAWSGHCRCVRRGCVRLSVAISSFVESRWRGHGLLFFLLLSWVWETFRWVHSRVKNVVKRLECGVFGLKNILFEWPYHGPVYTPRLVLVESLDPVSISNFTSDKDFLSASLTLFRGRKPVPTIMPFVLSPWQPLSGAPNGYHGNEAMPC